MFIWNLTGAKQSESTKRWESGIPSILKICAANEQQMEPPASAAFSSRLTHIAGLSGVWMVGKALMMRFPVPTCSLSTTNHYPRAMNICSFLAFPNTAYIPHPTTYKMIFWERVDEVLGYMKILTKLWHSSFPLDQCVCWWLESVPWWQMGAVSWLSS